MPASSYLKGVRTRYRNCLQVEIKSGLSILQTEVPLPEHQQYVFKSSKCVEKLKLYVNKLEVQSSKVADALGEEETEEIEKVVEEDCQLCSAATDCYLELEQYKERLVEFIKQESGEKHEKINPIQIVELQREMKDIVETQMKQQNEILIRQQMKENDESSVKLPKIDIISFYGDKIKWIEFWDSFESTIHKNKKLSKVEKFNYLKSKLGGEAKQAISGLNLSNDNYEVAVSILQERFGNIQVVIDLHYNEMINLESASNKTSSLRKFMDTLNRHLRSLEVLKQNVSQDIFVSMVKSKLPEEVLLQLEIQKESQEKWTVMSLCDKLRDYVVAREKSDKKETPKERSNGASNGSSNRAFNGGQTFRPKNKPWQTKNSRYQNGNRNGQLVNSAEALVATTDSKPSNISYFDKCRYCYQQHWSDECPKYQSIEERKRQLKGSCYKCLKYGHQSTDCKRNKICIHCNEKDSHHRSLCPKKFKLKLTSVHLSEEYNGNVNEECVNGINLDSYSDEGCEVVHENVFISSSEMVLMQTAKTKIGNPTNSMQQETRILFDSGSQRTYISQKLANKLKLKGEKEEEIKLITFGSDKPKIVKTSSTKLNIKLNNGKFFSIVANIVPVISGSIQRKRIDISSVEHLKHFVKDVELADDIPLRSESSSVELLIGNDYYLDLILSQRIEIQPGLYLLASKLGWILTGRSQEMDDEKTESGLLILSNTGDMMMTNHNTTDSSVSVIPDITDLWNLDSIGITEQIENVGDSKAMETFKETLQYENMRYFVKWPWKEEKYELPVNRELAMGRLKSCVARMRNKPELMTQYNSVIQDQLTKGIIELVDEKGVDGRKHFIPHHAVITPQKSTTKMRIVYDASAKMNKDVNSLNECLYRGPVMLRNLCGILIRFRLYRIALVADIEKAFLQVGLQNSDRDVTRFLWLKDIENFSLNNENIQEFRFCRVPFGVISSPFLLAATIESHLNKYNTPTAEQIRNNIYVDNLITGANTVTDALTHYSESKQIFKDASMNLREWISNSQSVNDFILPEDKPKVNQTKVLGHLWNIENDTLSVKHSQSFINSGNITKRKTLKEISEVFDPLGLFSPILISGKIFLQDLWKKHLRWDDELQGTDSLKWGSIQTELQQLSECQISRSIGIMTGDDRVQYRLLCFCDASGSAYAIVIYLHQTSSKSSKCDLIFSKSRLAPVKGMTIPRLELMAVLIGVRCLAFVKGELNVPIETIYLWTDSQCVLKWISTKKDLGVFVKNRITEIKIHKDVKFLYVSTKENPADVATRGTSTRLLCDNSLWWHGPEWLLIDIHQWKIFTCEDVLAKQEYKCELKVGKKTTESSALLCTKEIEGNQIETPYGIQCKNFSSYYKLIRVTAWVERFISRIKKISVKTSKILTCEELKIAEEKWIKFVQRRNYSDIFSAIYENKPNNLQNQLGLFISDDGFLRCKGRFENADLSEAARIPILLPRGEDFTRLIIERIHKDLFHSGVSQTLSKLRHKFWIPQGRSTVRQVLRHCLVCRRFEGGHYGMPKMPPFPRSRVSQSIPFASTGLDYLGPIYVKYDGENKKRWVCLFTCFVTRAIHLELLNDMTTEEFLYAFRRFVSIRGAPCNILSDNAAQFKLGSATLDLVWKKVIKCDDVQNYVSNAGIRWTFITELAPWMGGFYERLVGVVKRSLRKVLKGRLVSDVQLLTVIKETEAIVNARPLVYIGDDVNSNINLTPSHFLTLNPNIGIPEIEYDINDQSYSPVESSTDKLLKMWKKGQKLLDSFWTMWRDEYLLSLRERTQTKLKCGRVKSPYAPIVGDVVIIKDNLPRGVWKLGRLVQLIHSNDGEIRSAKVVLSSRKVISRPLNLLYPLEIEEKTKVDEENTCQSESAETRPVRKSAEKARRKIKDFYGE